MTTVLNSPVTAMPRYRPRTILALWLAAAGPMGLLAWVVAPAVAGPDPTPGRFGVCLISALTAGLVWQFVLVMIVVYRERGSLRWPVLKDALWLHAPSNARRHGGRLWWWALAAIAAVGVIEALPTGPSGPTSRNFGEFIGSSGGHDLMRGNWALFALLVVSFAFNTVLGEELFFRGLLLPRMGGNVPANAALFALYHVHQPWGMLNAFLGGLVGAYATKRWRSAWLGILAHSAQSVFFTVLLFLLVLS